MLKVSLGKLKVKILNNKVTTVIVVIGLALILYIYANAIHGTSNREINLKVDLMHRFIEYEKDFNRINECNRLYQASNKNDPKVLEACQLDYWLVAFAKASSDLNNIIVNLKKERPHLTRILDDLTAWKKEQEQRLLDRNVMLYWQKDYLNYQLLIVQRLDDESAKLYAEVLDHTSPSITQNQASTLSKEQACELLKRFGEKMDVNYLSQLLKAVKLNRDQCTSEKK